MRRGGAGGVRCAWGLPGKGARVGMGASDLGVGPGDVEESDRDLEWAGALAHDATII